jgi:hypothetical protein
MRLHGLTFTIATSAVTSREPVMVSQSNAAPRARYPHLRCLWLVPLTLVASAALAQGDINAGGQGSNDLYGEKAAITNCAAALVKELYPNRRLVVQTVVLQSKETNLRRPFGWTRRYALNAAVRGSAEPIAQSYCSVSWIGQVMSLHTSVTNAALLAATKPRDLRVKVANR